MVFTRTRYVPEHYGTAVESLSSHPDQGSMQPCPFMRLPVELRLQIYKEFLFERYRLSPAEIHEMILDPRHRNKCPPEILQVSKAINTEVKDLLQQETTFCLRICWQDATFDGFVRSCMQARGKRLDYEHIGHLKIAIYPPHVDRPMDMVHIWRQVKKLCEDLQRVSCLQHLSVHFMENEYAAWSLDSKPPDSLHVGWMWNEFGFMKSSDILRVLDLFTLLTNVTKAQIHLPDSLKDDSNLQKVRQDIEKVMMKVKSIGDGHRRWLTTLERVIDCNEQDLMIDTGILSQKKLDRSCGSGHWISESHLHIFEKVWPYRVYASKRRRDGAYLGDFENAPLSHVTRSRTNWINYDLAVLFGFED